MTSVCYIQVPDTTWYIFTFSLFSSLMDFQPWFPFHMNANGSGMICLVWTQAREKEGRVIEMHTFAYKERRHFSLMCIRKYIFLITTLKFFMIISLIKQRQKLLINISEACFTFIWRSQMCFFITFFCSICLLCLNYSFFQSYCTRDQ